MDALSVDPILFASIPAFNQSEPPAAPEEVRTKGRMRQADASLLTVLSPGTRCASVFARKHQVGNALWVGNAASEMYKPSENAAPCECGRACPYLASTAAPLPAAVIISGSVRCYERARLQLVSVGFTSISRIASVFLDANQIAATCCKDGNCGRGRGTKRARSALSEPAQRARIDGIARTHRRAWEQSVSDGLPRVIFEVSR